MKKRIISMALVLCMIVCMLPTAFVSAAGTDYCYNLTRLQYGQWSSEGVNPSTITDWNSIDALGNYFNRTTDPFKFYAQSATIDWRWTGSSHNEVGPTIDGSVGDWGGIVIRVGESAVYDVSMRIVDDASAANLDFYFAPASASNPQDAAYYLGSTAYSGEARALKTVSFGEQYLAAGDYIVVFKMTSKGTTYAALSNVTLTWVSDEKPIESYLYNLTRLQYGQWSDEGVAPSTITSWDAVDELGNYHNRTTDPFMYYGQSEGMTWTWTKTSGSSGGIVGPTITGGAGEWGGLTVRVGESQLYGVSLKYLNNSDGSPLKFYLAPADAENLRAEDYYLGQTAFANNGEMMKTDAFGTRYLEAGDYVLSFEIISQGSAYSAIAELGLTGLSTETSLDLNTQDGAAIRITEPQGMRFVSTIDRSIADSDDVVEYGTVLMPTDDLDGDVNHLVVGYSKNGHTAITAPAVLNYAEDEDTYTFTAVLIDILPKNYARSVSARAYIKLENGTYLYGATSTARSIYQVAELILKNADATEEEKAVAKEIVDTVFDLESKDNDAAWPWN